MSLSCRCRTASCRRVGAYTWLKYPYIFWGIQTSLALLCRNVNVGTQGICIMWTLTRCVARLSLGCWSMSACIHLGVWMITSVVALVVPRRGLTKTAENIAVNVIVLNVVTDAHIALTTAVGGSKRRVADFVYTAARGRSIDRIVCYSVTAPRLLCGVLCCRRYSAADATLQLRLTTLLKASPTSSRRSTTSGQRLRA